MDKYNKYLINDTTREERAKLIPLLHWNEIE